MAERISASSTSRHAAPSTSRFDGGTPPRLPAQPPLTVGVGTTAGDADALRALFAAVPDKSGMSFVVVQNDAGQGLIVADALEGCTNLPLTPVDDAVSLLPNRIYVASPGAGVVLDGDTLRLAPPRRSRAPRTPVDRFFSSLARCAGERAVGIVLCGGETVGTTGLKDIKEHGGLTIVEEQRDAASEGLAQSPFASSHVDMILPPGRIAAKLISYARHGYLSEAGLEEPVAEPAAPNRRRSEDLLPITELLRSETTHDFRRYRKNTLWRRIQRRMGMNQVDEVSEYVELLRGDRLEVQALRRDLLVCVTRFFRDTDAWDVLDQRVLRELVTEAAARGEPLRVWVPGCATGEEAYTLSMLLHERMAKSNADTRVQIFATDIAEDALDVGRGGVYPASAIEDLSSERLRKFFSSEAGCYRIAKKLRDSVVFAEQNVLGQPPFSRLDLICCRNLLIYLEPDAQRRVIDVFQYALKQGGHLFLGNSETVNTAKPLFKPVSKKWRIFRRTSMIAAPPAGAFGESDLRLPSLRVPQRPKHARSGERTRDIAVRVQRQLLRELDRGIAVVDSANRLLYLHGSADLYLQLSLGEMAADYPDLLTLARDGLRTKLRTAIRQVRQTQERAAIDCRVLRDGRYRRCVVTVRPLEGAIEDDGMLFVSFEPVQESAPAPADDSMSAVLGTDGGLVQDLQHELATTREQLNSTIEDLEAANDALRASNEEAISMNEELQSGNEELETSKEELQSLNEELTTLNHQLEAKVTELQSLTNDLDNLLTSSHVPTIFLDTSGCIRRFTPSCRTLFKLIETDVGRPLTDISASISDPDLLEDARAVLRDLQPRERQVRDDAGDRHYQRRMLPYRTADDRIEGVVVTFADVTDLQRTTSLLRRRERQQKGLASLGQRALVEKNLQALMDAAVQTVQQTFDADFVKLLELQPDEGVLLLRAGTGWRDGVVGSAVIEQDADSQAAYTFSSNQPVVVRNLVQDSRFHAPKLLLEHGVVSGISTVIRGPTRPFGVLGVHTMREATFTHDDVDFIDAVAHILSQAIQRGRSEQIVREAEERLRLATAATDLGTWDYDPRTDSIVASARSKELFGLPRDAIVRYQTFLARVHPRDRRRVDTAIRRSLDPRGSGHCDMEYRTVDSFRGHVRWIRDTRQTFFDSGTPVRMIGTLEDVTTRKEAEQADVERLHLADRLQRIAEAAPGTIFAFRIGPEGGPPSFPYTAPHVRETWGLDPEDIRDNAMPLFERIHPDDVQNLEQVTTASAEAMSMWHAQFRYEHPRKGRVWIESYATPVKEEDGGIVWHGIAHDITQVKQTEIELRAARRIAEAADQAKGEFLANMSHEIRTPMSAILGYTDILAGQLKDPDNLQSLHTIRTNGQYLLEIIDDILDLSRIEAGKLELDRQRVHPETLVFEVQSLLKLHAAEKGLSLDVEFAGRLPETVDTDPTRVKQILINLVENAIKFTEEGSVRIAVRLLEDERLLCFDVVDTGIGIPQDTLAKLFRPFTQADSSVTRRFGGSGLGLSISRALGKMLGGDVTVETRVGEGSTFSLTIATGDLVGVPLFDPQKREPSPRRWQEDVRTLDCYVLVVDDRRDMRYLAQHMLEEAGARVAVARDGRDALAQVAEAERAGDPFDAVLLDMQMPVVDGYAAATELRSRGFDSPIVALTANAMKRDERKCLACGCDDYLSKPLARATLVNTLAYYTQDVSRTELAARRQTYAAADSSPGASAGDPAGPSAPAKTEPTEDADAVNASNDAGESSARRVLLVDDNLDSCMLLKMLLESTGCEVVTAVDGPAALAAAAEAPDVAIIDLGLPGMSGQEVLTELRSRPKGDSCRYICLSGRHQSEIDWRGAGFDHYVQKPARFEELKKLLFK